MSNKPASLNIVKTPNYMFLLNVIEKKYYCWPEVLNDIQLLQVQVLLCLLRFFYTFLLHQLIFW